MSAALSDGERREAAREEACARICDELGWRVCDLVQAEADANGDVWVTVRVSVPRHDVDVRAVRIRGATAQPAQVTK